MKTGWMKRSNPYPTNRESEGSEMSEMVERVARVAHDAQWEEPFPAEGTIAYAIAIQVARAAIEAMREPTKPMIFYGMDAMCRDDLEPTEDEFRRGFQGAIDAALSPSGEK
jgi:hypothetical protein